MLIQEIEIYVLAMQRTDSDLPLNAVVVRVQVDSGFDGWGEGAWDRCSTASVAARKDGLGAILIGRSVFDIAELPSLDVLRPAGLLSAVEMACWDLVGRAARQPLCRLFGGDYRPAMPVAVRLPMAGPQRTAEVSHALAEQGFRTQIVTACGRAEVDLHTLASVRGRVGGQVSLRFDGAMCYDAETARELCLGLESFGLECFIDPVDAVSCEPVAALGAQTSVGLALCRSIASPRDVLTAVRRRAASTMVLDLNRVGGLLNARKCAAVAEAGGVATMLGGASAGIATAAALQLAASIPALSNCNESVYHQLRDDVLTKRLPILDGAMAVPHGPGLGIEVDRAKVERFQIA